MNSPSAAIRIRPMAPADLDRVIEIAASLKQAPQWPRSAYLTALDSKAAPPHIALVAELPETVAAAPTNSEFRASDFDSLEWKGGASSEGNGDGTPADRSSPPARNLVAGFIVASLLPPQAELEIIAVAPRFQRRGLARRLFTALAAELRSTLAAKLSTGQPAELLLELRASNLPALAFYGSLGFMEAGRRPCYYHDPIEDALLMRLRVE
jgi:ribosomal protein S18 acetylase RimI-like enzyme